MAPEAARILIADSLPETCVSLLKEGGLEVTVKTGLAEDALCGVIGGFDGLIVRSSTQVTAKVFAAGKRLKVVGRAGVGVDNIDVAAATKAGVAVENTPFGNITSAAEHTVAMIFSAVRNIPRADKLMKDGVWDKKSLTGMELDGKMLGVIGYGKVGAIVARILEAANMTVQVFDPYLTAARAAEFGVKKVELDELLKTSDVITIHTPLSDATKNLLNADNLRKMKKTAYIVNCARGGIIDEAALKAVLDEGKLAGAALDVFAEEPYPKAGPLVGA
ncbi:MAG TPA: hydroxyacid dehydrogenase, partial [Planctomycetota bacterium]|nr:hydroxyacid dehydrogenase [Planctomycetota bacterium]